MVVYISTPGAHLGLHADRLVVEEPNKETRTVRLREVERVVLLGWAGVTSAAMAALMERGIETAVLGRDGRYRGRLVPAAGRNVLLRREQFRRYDDAAFRIGIAKTIVDAKVRNARTVVLRHARNHPSSALDVAAAELAAGRARATASASMPELMGMEGDAARTYFGAFKEMQRGALKFAGRSRRPPRDPVNAMLSFGYVLTTTTLTSAVATAGLDPYVGMYHELDYGRPSLALDLLEEFRAPMVDRLALRIANLGILGEDDFTDEGEEGVRMTPAARDRYLAEYHALVDQAAPAGDGRDLSWNAVMREQAERMRAAIEGKAAYKPFECE